jgi:hypothetical protein
VSVQVWVGEKPEHANERRAIVALANGLDRLEGLYLLLSNFHVGGRTIDLAIIKQDALFIIELKNYNGKISGGVNGPWFVESSNGERKRLNPGRGNPYNQVISYYYSLTNFLNEHRTDFLSEHKARTVNFRTCRRLVVIAPTIHKDSQIELDWKVEARGLDELPSYLVTERSSEIDLTEEEMLAIPTMLGCTRWKDINQLMAGVLPQWSSEDKGNEQQAAPAQPTPAQSTPLSTLNRLRGALGTTTGRVALVMSIATMFLLLVVFTQLSGTVASPPEPPRLSLVNATTGPAGGVFGEVIPNDYDNTCIWAEFQPIGKRWNPDTASWISVGVDGTTEDLSPEVVVTLEQVNYCGNQISLTWSVRNNSNSVITFPLRSENITIRDPLGNTYPIDNSLSRPGIIEVRPGGQENGTAIVPAPIIQNVPSLLVRLKEKPFGESSWLVSLEET